MKYKLPRPIVSREINRIVAREMRKQKMTVSRVSKADLEEIAAVSKTIKNQSLPNYLVCKKLEHNLGRGIFLHPDAKPILKNQVIGCYAGEVSLEPQNQLEDGAYVFIPVENICLKKEEQLLLDRYRRYHPRRLYSLKVDALKEGNFTRFINHSEKPNIVAHLLEVPSNRYGLDPVAIEVIYIAKKTIKPGQQLLVSYEDGEKSYWSALKIVPFPMTPETFQLSPSLKVVKVK